MSSPVGLLVLAFRPSPLMAPDSVACSTKPFAVRASRLGSAWTMTLYSSSRVGRPTFASWGSRRYPRCVTCPFRIHLWNGSLGPYARISGPALLLERRRLEPEARKIQRLLQ